MQKATFFILSSGNYFKLTSVRFNSKPFRRLYGFFYRRNAYHCRRYVRASVCWWFKFVCLFLCYYSHRLRESVSPICVIFDIWFEDFSWYWYQHLTYNQFCIRMSNDFMSGVEVFLMKFNTTPDTQWFLYQVKIFTPDT